MTGDAIRVAGISASPAASLGSAQLDLMHLACLSIALASSVSS